MTLNNKIKIELEKLDNLVNKIKELLELIKTNNNPIYSEGLVSGLALYLENFYGGIERIFSLIGKEIDGSIPSGESWHLQLLNRMLMDIPSVRCAVISQNTYEQINEFRGFRHVARNLYAYELKPERIINLGEKVEKCYDNFHSDIMNFTETLII